MSIVRIFVEGTADERFLRELMEDCCGDADWQRVKFQILKGKDNLLARKHWQGLTSYFAEVTDAGGTNLVILDADGSWRDRQTELAAFRADTNVAFESFLLPDDHQPGELEDLLFAAVPAENQPILTCFDGMVECLMAGEKPFRIPDVKEKKVYVYLDIVLPDEKIKREKTQPPNRDFRGAAHWNLSAAGLERLRAFLQRHLLPTP